MRRLATVLSTCAALGGVCGQAQAQRAASTPTSEEAAGPVVVPPRPPGFPAPLGEDFVFGGEVETHLQTDVVNSNHRTHVSAFNDADVTGFLNYRGMASLNAEGKLERNRDNNANSYFVDRNAFFRSEGATLRQLYATLRPVDGLAVYAGKIHPNFGSAYESAPGQFYNFGTDYEQDERIGIGGSYFLPVRFGPESLGLADVRITGEAFYLDTSVLSTSVLSSPALDDPTADRLRRFSRSQYGPSNTGGLSSATVSIRGGRPSRGLAWQVSITRESTSEPGGRSEFGQSVGASFDPGGHGISLGPRLGVTPFLEYTHFTNFLGIAGLERHYAVGGLAFLYTRWVVSLAGGLRNSAGAAIGTDHQESISFTYELPAIKRFLVGAGVNFINVGGHSSWALAPSLSYSRAF